MILTSSPLMNAGLKIILSLIFRIIPLRARIDQEDKGEELLSLCVMILNSQSLTRNRNNHKIQLVYQQFLFHQHPLSTLRYSITLKTQRIIKS